MYDVRSEKKKNELNVAAKKREEKIKTNKDMIVNWREVALSIILMTLNWGI